MKQGIAKLITSSILLLSQTALAQSYQAGMIAYKDCHEYVESLDFMAKPQLCNMSSQALTFMIRGDNIAVIDKSSLKLSRLEIAGKDMRYNRKGDKKYDFGSFPKVDEDGKYGIFDLELNSVPFGKVGQTSLQGSIDILASEGVNVDDRKIDLSKPFTIRVGSLSISNQSKQTEKQDNGLIGDATQALADGMKEAFLGSDKDKLTLYITGNHDSIVDLEVFENGEKLDQGWYTTDGSERQRTFSKPKQNKVSLKLKYWKELKRVTVPITL